ncbi:amidohydrolase family protein [Alcanivorax quisquiliarum]|uniref:Amidohydrolase n=1 Tax=Alcanivorax quisquiliarum TaxID=2933565 RepID=A0ABT0E441_9GAMM|nr:amidohydrolase family protein [Alcanivorax quisquiliarum]MCK0536590.1 amidohydrolase [Alcanivorax quisquiliarum]
MLLKKPLLQVWLCGAAFACLPGASFAERAERIYSDAQLHYVNFVQETDGMEALFKAMDEARIQDVAIMGLGVAKKWEESAPREPRYYMGDEAPVYYYSATDALLAEAIQTLPGQQRERLHPFIAGFNPTDMNAVRHVELMLEMYPDLWKGIGEILTRHDDLTALTKGETPRANHPALDAVYELAAERSLPVILHSNLTSKREREPIYRQELKEALAAHPQTRFIWAHAGTSAEIHRYQGKIKNLDTIVGELLAAHDNLYIDLSWTVLEPYLLEEGVPTPRWLALVEQYPDRFMIGTDLVGRFGNLGKNIQGFDRFLDALPQEVADKVARTNLLALLPEHD